MKMLNKKNFVLVIIAVFTLSLMVMACGSKEAKKESPKSAIAAEYEGAPDWVIKGCNAYWGDKAQNKICGVGSAGSTRNISLARSTATSRGRTEIARSLSVKVKSMLKDYQATVTGGENYGTAADDEQYVVDVSKQITDMSLSGTQMVDSWLNTKTGTLYALVALDIDAFKSAVNGMKDLDDSVRKFVEENATKAFEELDAEVDKAKE